MPEISRCLNHPEREAALKCEKHGRGLCARCLQENPRCFDPELYCKFRPQCLIHFQEKELRRQAARAGQAG